MGQVRREPTKEIEGEWPEMGAGVGSQVISVSVTVVDDLSGLCSLSLGYVRELPPCRK